MMMRRRRRRRRRLSTVGEIEADESCGYVVYLHMTLMMLSDIYLIICDCSYVRVEEKYDPMPLLVESFWAFFHLLQLLNFLLFEIE